MRLLHEQDGPLGGFGEPAATGSTSGFGNESGRSLLFEGPSPDVEGLRSDTDQRPEVGAAQFAGCPEIEDEHTLFERKGGSRGSLIGGASRLRWLLTLGDTAWFDLGNWCVVRRGCIRLLRDLFAQSFEHLSSRSRPIE